MSFVCALIAAIIFGAEFLGAKWSGHDLTVLGLFFVALAMALGGLPVVSRWVHRGPE
jgi:hypothetical protein